MGKEGERVKRTLLLGALFCALLLCSCASEGPKGAMEAYRDILLGEESFVTGDTGKSLLVSQIGQVVSGTDVKAGVKAFSLVDMDGDGVPELLLWITTGDQEPETGYDWGYEILKYQEGTVYGYSIWYRGLRELKEDGSFWFSGGLSYFGFGTLEFKGKDVLTVELACSKTADDGTVTCFVEGKEVTGEAFREAEARQAEKPNAVWYEYTGENVAKYLENP